MMSSTLAPAAEVIHWPGQPLENGAHGLSPAKAGHELVGNVAGIKIWKYQNIGPARHHAAGRLRRADSRDEGGVSLQLAVDGKIRTALPDELRSTPHLVNPRMRRTAVRREGEQGDARRCFQKKCRALG